MTSIIPYKHKGVVNVLDKAVDYITIDEHNSIKRAVDIVYERSSHSENDHWMHDRDALLVQMLWTTGARITDVLAMSSKKLDFNNRNIEFLVKKRKRIDKKTKVKSEFWHKITLDMETLTEIMAYIHSWRIDGLLFPSYRNSGKSLTRQAVALKVKELAKVVGVTRNMHCHLWRHALAMFLQGQGTPIELISYHLGHSGTDITLQTYARLDEKQERSMLDNLGIRLR
jgi:integrase/recombinase XerD